MADQRLSPVPAARVAGVARWLALLWAVGCAACQSSASTPPALPGTGTDRVAAAPASGFGNEVRIVEAKGQGLEFPLPDPAGWRLDKRERHSWVARHRKSSSELVVRAWQFDGIARPEDCERDARLWRSGLPQWAPGEVISSSEPMLAGVYRSHVTVGVQAAARGSPERLLGHVLGFGSDARSCLMLAFSTAAAGPGARSVLAERLAIVAGSVFERARRLEIEGRVVVPRL